MLNPTSSLQIGKYDTLAILGGISGEFLITLVYEIYLIGINVYCSSKAMRGFSSLGSVWCLKSPHIKRAIRILWKVTIFLEASYGSARIENSGYFTVLVD